MNIFEETIGVGHFLFDRTPAGIALAVPKPRVPNVLQRDGRPLVARMGGQTPLKAMIAGAVEKLGPLSLLVRPGDRVLVKPNFNSPDPPPASTDPEFLAAVVELLKDAGAEVTVGESSGAIWRPTSNVLKKLGLFDLAAKLGFQLISFEQAGVNDWVRVKIGGDYVSSVAMPRVAYEADKLVYLPCMKTHRLAAFSGALKLAFGFTHPGERRFFHRGHLQEKLAEVNLCWQPQLIIADGRQAFVTGGPNTGRRAEPGVILASGDLVAIDIEAVRILESHGADLPTDPVQLPQIRHALRHKLGSPPGAYDVVE